nr:H205 [uncultured bacterium]
MNQWAVVSETVTGNEKKGVRRDTEQGGRDANATCASREQGAIEKLKC